MKEEPNKWLVDDFDDWIALVTQRFCSKRTIHPYDQDDLIQFVKLRLVEKIEVIKEKYKGEASVRTYIHSVILNFCREFKRKNF